MCSIQMDTPRSRFWIGLPPFMDDIVVSKDGVTLLLKGMNPSKALGPNELHPKVLKERATEYNIMWLISMPVIKV